MVDRSDIIYYLSHKHHIWRAVYKCGREPALTEAQDQCMFAFLSAVAKVDPEPIKAKIPYDLYKQVKALSAIRIWSMFLPTDIRHALLSYCGNKSAAARQLGLPYSTYYHRLETALDKLSDLIPSNYI